MKIDYFWRAGLFLLMIGYSWTGQVMADDQPMPSGFTVNESLPSASDSLYDLADSGYWSAIIREELQKLGHVPLIDHNPRRGEKIEFLPHEAERYKNRTVVERTNGDLKNNHGGRHVRVRGAAKVYTHLMYGILVIAAEQLLRLLN